MRIADFQPLLARIESHFTVELVSQPLECLASETHVRAAAAWGKERRFSQVLGVRASPDGSTHIERVLELEPPSFEAPETVFPRLQGTPSAPMYAAGLRL